MPDETTTAPPQLKYERTTDFLNTYANNAYFESSAWDFRIIFGQLDQSSLPEPAIKQNVAITIPWAQAKLALYWIRLHVEANEIQNGKILIRADLLPPVPNPPTDKDD